VPADFNLRRKTMMRIVVDVPSAHEEAAVAAFLPVASAITGRYNPATETTHLAAHVYAAGFQRSISELSVIEGIEMVDADIIDEAA
jgi:hypothetical protein